MQSNFSFIPNQSRFFEVETLSGRYISLLRQNGVEIQSEPERVREAFATLTPQEQDSYLKRLDFAYHCASVSVAENTNLMRDKRFVWRTLLELKARPPMDLLEHIQENDYVEIYDFNGIQHFANFEFCRLISYTLEETLLYPWHVLYQRDEAVAEKIFAAVDQCAKREKGPFKPDIPLHECHELKSGTGRIFQVEMKMFSPILDQTGQKGFLLATSKIQRLN